jgi:nucleotide-binding universal stress UspA family protein
MGFGVPVGLSIHNFEEERQMTRRLSRWLARLVDVAEERGVRATMDLIPADTSVAEEIKRRASEEGVDLVMVGTNGSTGLEGLLRGSISSAIVKQADCPVLVVR